MQRAFRLDVLAYPAAATAGCASSRRSTTRGQRKVLGASHAGAGVSDDTPAWVQPPAPDGARALRLPVVAAPLTLSPQLTHNPSADVQDAPLVPGRFRRRGCSAGAQNVPYVAYAPR